MVGGVHAFRVARGGMQMTVLLAGGNAVLQRSMAGALLAAAHGVRIVCSTATAVNEPWPAGIEPRRSVSSRADIAAATEGCDTAVLVDPAVVGMAPRRATPMIG